MGQALEALIQAYVAHSGNEELTRIGAEMFRLYTEMGFPPDMFLDKLKELRTFETLELVYVVSVYQTQFLNHKRLAGASEKNLDKTRRRNIEEIERLLTRGEIGAY